MFDVIRVAVVDDHPLMRAGVQRVLRRARDIRLVGEGASADDACRIADEEEPDVMLIDVKMPGGGLNATRTIVNKNPRIKVIVLTGLEEDSVVTESLSEGASGFVLKGTGSGDLLTAIREVHSGNPYVSPEISSRILIARARGPVMTAAPTGLELLNPREQQILNLASSGKTNVEIAEALQLALPTIKNTMSRIFQKINVRNRSEAIALVLKK